jgi:hypothetical protein
MQRLTVTEIIKCKVLNVHIQAGFKDTGFYVNYDHEFRYFVFQTPWFIFNAFFNFLETLGLDLE